MKKSGVSMQFPDNYLFFEMQLAKKKRKRDQMFLSCVSNQLFPTVAHKLDALLEAASNESVPLYTTSFVAG